MNTHESLEIFDRFNFELRSGVLIAHEYCSRMLLECADCPHVIDALLNSHVQCESLIDPGNDDEYFTSVHDGADANCERIVRYFGDIIAKESRIGNYGLLGKGFETSARYKTRSWLIESDVSVRANT